LTTSNSYKSFALATELRSALANRFATVSEVLFDTDLAPYIAIGSLGANSQSAIVKIVTDQPLGVDGLGLSPRGFSPHRAQVVLETSTIANVPLMTGANNLLLMGEVLKFGMKTELWMTTNTTVVSPGAGTLKATFDVSSKWGSMSSI
jgi:hypothetical protein